MHLRCRRGSSASRRQGGPVKDSCGLQLAGSERQGGAYLFKQIRLRRFQVNQPAEYVENIDQFRRILSRLVVGLNIAQL